MTIEPRKKLWIKKEYKVVQKGKGWTIESFVEKGPGVQDLDAMLDEFFKKRKKWE